MFRIAIGIRPGVLCGCLLLMLCGARPSNAQLTSFNITLQNLTNSAPNSGQTFSAPVFFTHDGTLVPWTMGGTASDPLRQIAEEGNNAPLLTDLSLAGSALGSVQVLSGPQLPGTTQMFTLTTNLTTHPFLSDVWMLGRTNDGFSGQAGINLASITTPMTFNLIGLDAGTEVNNELRAYLPALGGVFNDPENGVITAHTGIRGDADAPASWNFSGSVARITINPSNVASAPEASPFLLLACGLAGTGLVLRGRFA